MNMKMKNKPLYFIDVETTGLDPNKDRIIEFCIIKKGHFEITKLHRKVDPEGMKISPEAKKVNGYEQEKWSNAISQKEASNQISEFMRVSGIVIAHNVCFDSSFINTLLLKYGHKTLARRKVDTYTLAYEHLVPMGLKSLRFDEIRKFMGWRVYDHHDAYTDTVDLYRFHQYVTRMGMTKKIRLYIKSIPYRLKNME